MKKLLLLALFLLAPQAHAATATAVASGVTTGASASLSQTLSITVPSGNQNNLLLVYVSNRCGGETFTATYNGTSMTLGQSPAAAFAFQSAYFYLPAPTVGTANVVVSWGSACTDTTVGAVVLKDAFQGAPDIDGYLGQNTATSITKSVTTTIANTLGVMWVAEDNFGGLSSGWTEVGSQTRQVSTSSGGSVGSYMEIATLPFTSSGSNSMGLTWTGARAADEMLVAIKYQAPAATFKFWHFFDF